MKNLDATFAALSDPTRRAILARLTAGRLTVGELAEPFNISAPAISRHLRVLEAASLIVREPRGQHRVCRLEAAALAAASEWLDDYRRFWSAGVDRLERHPSRKKTKRNMRSAK